jgi:hypothetical protein
MKIATFCVLMGIASIVISLVVAIQVASEQGEP